MRRTAVRFLRSELDYAAPRCSSVIVTIPILLLAMLVDLPGCRPGGDERILTCAKEAERFTIVLPERFNPAVQWPALIILHGNGRNYLSLVQAPETRGALLRSKAVLVLPDGGKSWWLDEARILHLLDGLLKPLHIDPRRIGCSGWSMGGYGSLRMVTRHPDRFTFWGGIIGLVDFPNPGYPPEYNHEVPAVFGNPADWTAANPIHSVDRLRGKSIWFATADKSFDVAMNRELDRVLNRRGIPHTFKVIEGAHSFAVVAELLPKLLSAFERSAE